MAHPRSRNGLGRDPLCSLARPSGSAGVGGRPFGRGLSGGAGQPRGLRLAERSLVLQGDWASALAADSFDIVVSNPPYIETDAIAGLDRDVREHDPCRPWMEARTDSRPIGSSRPTCLGFSCAGGLAAFEVGQGQDAAVSALMAGAGLTALTTRLDLAGIARVVTGPNVSHGRSVGLLCSYERMRHHATCRCRTGPVMDHRLSSPSRSHSSFLPRVPVPTTWRSWPARFRFGTASGIAYGLGTTVRRAGFSHARELGPVDACGSNGLADDNLTHGWRCVFDLDGLSALDHGARGAQRSADRRTKQPLRNLRHQRRA